MPRSVSLVPPAPISLPAIATRIKSVAQLQRQLASQIQALDRYASSSRLIIANLLPALGEAERELRGTVELLVRAIAQEQQRQIPVEGLGGAKPPPQDKPTDVGGDHDECTPEAAPKKEAPPLPAV